MQTRFYRLPEAGVFLAQGPYGYSCHLHIGRKSCFLVDALRVFIPNCVLGAISGRVLEMRRS